ncbi:MAG: hypothetical protein AAFR75_07130 [Pseudomonadota bacterium]
MLSVQVEVVVGRNARNIMANDGLPAYFRSADTKRIATTVRVEVLEPFI